MDALILYRSLSDFYSGFLMEQPLLHYDEL